MLEAHLYFCQKVGPYILQAAVTNRSSILSSSKEQSKDSQNTQETPPPPPVEFSVSTVEIFRIGTSKIIAEIILAFEPFGFATYLRMCSKGACMIASSSDHNQADLKCVEGT